MPQNRELEEKDGSAVSSVEVTDVTDKRGTDARFCTDEEIFTHVDGAHIRTCR